MTAGKRIGTPEQRRFTRIAHGGAVKYRLDADHNLRARCLDIGWGGAALRLGRYLRPGTPLELIFSDSRDRAETVRGRLVWCHPVAGSTEFIAGIEANLDHGETVYALSSVLLGAVAGSGVAAPGRCSCGREKGHPPQRTETGSICALVPGAA